MSFITKLFYVGFFIPLLFLGVEYYMSPYKEYTPTKLGIQQPQISKQHEIKQGGIVKLIDQKTGGLDLIGWDTNIENNIFVNYEDAAPLSSSMYALNILKYRTWDYFILHTPLHVIQVIFVDISFPVCPSSVIVFEKKDPRKTMKKQEELFKCPEFDRHRLSLGDKAQLLSSKLNVTVLKQGKTSEYIYKLNSNELDLNFELKFDYNEVPSTVWSIPLSQDKTNYFATMKKPALSLQGPYSYQGKKYLCQEKDCLMMIDNGRGHQNYGIAYYWIMIMFKTKEGKVVTINLSDGIGNNYKSLDKASEDFIVIDGQFYKLDIHEMDYYKDNYVTKKTIRTAKETEHYKRMFPQRKCAIIFNPIGDIEDGVNVGIIAFKQYLIYGLFDITCTIDGIKVEAEKVYGHVEHVFSRW